jgi:hypothetical protein
VVDDTLQVGGDVVVKDNLEIADGTSQSCSGEAVVDSGVVEGAKLSWLVFGVEDDLVGLLLEVRRVGDAESDVEEAIDGNYVGVPLNNGSFEVVSGRIVDSVQLAVVVLAGVERVGCGGGGERKGYGEGLHGSWAVLRVG